MTFPRLDYHAPPLSTYVVPATVSTVQAALKTSDDANDDDDNDDRSTFVRQD